TKWRARCLSDEGTFQCRNSPCGYRRPPGYRREIHHAATGLLHFGHHRLRNIGVGVDVLHVVVVVQGFHQAHDFPADLDIDVAGRLGHLADLGHTRRQVVLLQRFADLVERSRVTDDVKGVPRPSEIFGAGVEDDAHQGVFVDGTRIDAERTLALEEEADVAGAAHLAAVALEDLAHFAVGAVAVVGEHVDQDGHAAGTIAFVGDLFKRYAFGLAGAALDGPFDVVLGHADFAGLVNGIAKLEVGFGVAAAVPRGDDDRPAQLAEELAALGVDGAFLVLDGCP